MVSICEESLAERVESVRALLRPDEVHNHRVSDGLALTDDQLADLHESATDIQLFVDGMDSLSRAALRAPGSDRTMRIIRSLLGTEAIYQSVLRGEINQPELPSPRLSKADLILTDSGFRIAEIEPGKIRGIGYARMVREQATRAIGSGVELALASMTDESDTAVAMSEGDKFHEPEIRLLGKFVTYLHIAPQRELVIDNGGKLTTRYGDRISFDKAIIMSPFFNNGLGISESDLRQSVEVVSDRRPDLESKGALALVHNTDSEQCIEELLVQHFGQAALDRLRSRIPPTMHIALMEPGRFDDARRSVLDDSMPVFLKPLSNSGTRGIATPEQKEDQRAILAKHKTARKFVIQAAFDSVRINMHSMDVLSGTEYEDTMCLRVTIHTDHNGNMLESSVVGSPHEFLAHGGKTSVITNLEGPNND